MIGDTEPITEALVEPFAALALACVHREEPHCALERLAHERGKPVRDLTPAFYGCFDWHSSVHSHWTLARVLRSFPDGRLAGHVRRALDESLQHERLRGELAYLEPRPTFERPYGWAWLLLLAAELHAWDDTQARRWAEALAPLADLVRHRTIDWLATIVDPDRSGLHRQAAFAFGLFHDHGRIAGERVLCEAVERRARDFYLGERAASLADEPGPHDFLSPVLAAADVVRRVLPPDDFATWLDEYLPAIPREPRTDWLLPVRASDPGDYRLSHLDGLCLSRAWMLAGIAAGLPESDARRPALLAVAREHRHAGLQAIAPEHYSGSHWLGSFAVYLLTGRGEPAGRAA